MITWLWGERSPFPALSEIEENWGEIIFAKEGMEKLLSPGESFIQVRWQSEKLGENFKNIMDFIQLLDFQQQKIPIIKVYKDFYATNQIQ